MKSVLVIFLTFVVAQGQEDGCLKELDFSGSPCRVFSRCPLENDAEFLGMNTDFPCEKYVFDRPDLFILDTKSLQYYLQQRFAKEELILTSPSTSTTETPTSYHQTSTSPKTFAPFTTTSASTSIEPLTITTEGPVIINTEKKLDQESPTHVLLYVLIALAVLIVVS